MDELNAHSLGITRIFNNGPEEGPLFMDMTGKVKIRFCSGNTGET